MSASTRRTALAAYRDAPGKLPRRVRLHPPGRPRRLEVRRQPELAPQFGARRVHLDADDGHVKHQGDQAAQVCVASADVDDEVAAVVRAEPVELVEKAELLAGVLVVVLLRAPQELLDHPARPRLRRGRVLLGAVLLGAVLLAVGPLQEGGALEQLVADGLKELARGGAGKLRVEGGVRNRVGRVAVQPLAEPPRLVQHRAVPSGGMLRLGLLLVQHLCLLLELALGASRRLLPLGHGEARRRLERGGRPRARKIKKFELATQKEFQLAEEEYDKVAFVIA